MSPLSLTHSRLATPASEQLASARRHAAALFDELSARNRKELLRLMGPGGNASRNARHKCSRPLANLSSLSAALRTNVPALDT